MARRLRIDVGGICYHVINRRVGRQTLFAEDGDFAAFEKVLAEVCRLFPDVLVIAYCLMRNHWHLVLLPRRDGRLSAFMQRLTVTHMRRWHAHQDSAGTGPVYQGRFKSFPIEQDDHLLTVCRYVERNALRAGIVRRARNWPWCSMAKRQLAEPPPWLLPPARWPVTMPADWESWVDRAQTPAEIEALRRSVNRGTPYGSPGWQLRVARRLKLESSLRDPWRPKRVEKAKAPPTAKTTKAKPRGRKAKK
jgi:putative transposase